MNPSNSPDDPIAHEKLLKLREGLLGQQQSSAVDTLSVTFDDPQVLNELSAICGFKFSSLDFELKLVPDPSQRKFICYITFTPPREHLDDLFKLYDKFQAVIFPIRFSVAGNSGFEQKVELSDGVGSCRISMPDIDERICGSNSFALQIVDGKVELIASQDVDGGPAFSSFDEILALERFRKLGVEYRGGPQVALPVDLASTSFGRF